LGPALVAIGRIVSRAAVAGVIVITLLALFDLWFQRAQHAKEMKMSKKELRDEHKSSEGDPMVKARIRQVQREVASQRMMEEVPNATVVVTNPTHFAVALRYTSEEGGAPRVVAKGVDEIARKIKDVAREAGVLVYEDPPLARALHRGCQIGDEVPEELFQAVAGVLAYVYRVQGGAPQPA
jgi:flagellar biosynthesis protein FlhB